MAHTKIHSYININVEKYHTHAKFVKHQISYFSKLLANIIKVHKNFYINCMFSFSEGNTNE